MGDNMQAGPEIVRLVELGQYEAVENLIQRGCNVNEKDYYGQCAIINAAARNDLKMFKLLVQHGADVAAVDDFGNSAHLWASINKNKDMLKIIEQHSNTNKKKHHRKK